MTTLQHPADTRVIPEWELCDRLRRSMRLVPGLDNHDVAEFLGCAPATVSTWLNGRRNPSKAVQMLWADMTGVSRDWLMYGGEYAMRDLNPQPADYGSGALAPVLRLFPGPRIVRPFPRPATVKARFTVDRLGA